ncbi:MAG: signal recognition particle receptor subunit alpha [Pirellulaceae bacterium]
MFESLSDGLQAAFKSIRGKGKLTEANMRDGLQMVETAMLEADVSYSVVQDFMSHVTEQALGSKVLLAAQAARRVGADRLRAVNRDLGARRLVHPAA